MAINRRDKTKTDRASKVHKDWYKLDLSAIVYPTLQRRDFSSVYRLSVLLKEEIDPEMLQRAVNLTMPRFPTYKAAIRKGVFWRYLEPNDRPGPFVQEDVKNPCQPMYFKANNRYLVRIYYYRNRIALEAHHSLGDGTGGMCVLQTLTATYLRLKGHTEIENGGFVLDILETPDPVELEDAYMKYANAKVCPPRPGEKAYRVRGTKEPFYTLNIIDGNHCGCCARALGNHADATFSTFNGNFIVGINNLDACAVLDFDGSVKSGDGIAYRWSGGAVILGAVFLGGIGNECSGLKQAGIGIGIVIHVVSILGEGFFLVTEHEIKLIITDSLTGLNFDIHHIEIGIVAGESQLLLLVTVETGAETEPFVPFLRVTVVEYRSHNIVGHAGPSLVERAVGIIMFKNVFRNCHLEIHRHTHAEHTPVAAGRFLPFVADNLGTHREFLTCANLVGHFDILDCVARTDKQCCCRKKHVHFL